MPDLDLAARLRDYARGKGSAALVVSSAWLAREFDVDPRTIAAALRPFGVKPGEVESGVRGYSVAELAGMELPAEDPTVEWAVQPPASRVQWADDEPPDVLAGRIPTEPSAMPDGWPGPGWHDLVDPAAVDGGSLKPCRPIPYDDDEPDAIARLSAGAGHDMTPALRAAGLL